MNERLEDMMSLLSREILHRDNTLGSKGGGCGGGEGGGFLTKDAVWGDGSALFQRHAPSEGIIYIIYHIYDIQNAAPVQCRACSGGTSYAASNVANQRWE